MIDRNNYFVHKEFKGWFLCNGEDLEQIRAVVRTTKPSPGWKHYVVTSALEEFEVYGNYTQKVGDSILVFKCYKIRENNMISIQELLEGNYYKEEELEQKYTASLPTEFGDLVVHTLSDYQSNDHIVIESHKENISDTPLIRIHSECLTGDVFHSIRCDCKNQLHKAIERIVKEGGYIFYLRQEGRGIGLKNKIGAYALQQTQGLDTQEANHQLGLPDDSRNYDLVANWLKENNYMKVKLMSNNPLKIKSLEDNGIEVVVENHQVDFCEINAGDYLRTKKEKHGHKLNFEEKENG